MEYRTYKLIGSALVLFGLAILIIDIKMGALEDAIYSTFQVNADYWTWSYLLFSLLFVILGIYYIIISLKEKETNKIISASAILQFIALILSIIVLIDSIFSKSEWNMLPLIMEIPISIIMLVGIILLIVGSFKKQEKS